MSDLVKKYAVQLHSKKDGFSLYNLCKKTIGMRMESLYQGVVLVTFKGATLPEINCFGKVKIMPELTKKQQFLVKKNKERLEIYGNIAFEILNK